MSQAKPGHGCYVVYCTALTSLMHHYDTIFHSMSITTVKVCATPLPFVEHDGCSASVTHTRICQHWLRMDCSLQLRCYGTLCVLSIVSRGQSWMHHTLAVVYEFESQIETERCVSQLLPFPHHCLAGSYLCVWSTHWCEHPHTVHGRRHSSFE